jgi:hypothetical protein
MVPPAVTPPAVTPPAAVPPRAELAPTNQVASTEPIATPGKAAVPGPAETGAEAIAKAEGALPPSILPGSLPPAEALSPMGAKVAAALATQPPPIQKGAQTAESTAETLKRLDNEGVEYKHRTALAEKDADNYSKNIQDYSKIGILANKSLPSIQIAMKQVQDPRYYSGILSDPYTWIQKGLAGLSEFGFGDNKAAAAPMEVFDKILSGNIVNDLKVLLGGLGQIRLAEIDLITKSVANRYNTPAANMAVLQMMSREHTQAANIGQIAEQYDKGWELNDAGQWARRTEPTSSSGLSATINKYVTQHPLFTQDEINNINKVLDISSKVPNEKAPADKVRKELSKAAGIELPGEPQQGGAAAIPSAAIEALRRGEGNAQQFDAFFGPGSAAKVLGTK